MLCSQTVASRPGLDPFQLQFPVLQQRPHLRRPVQCVRGSPWESPAKLHGICSRLNRRTGQMGALLYCKTKHLFGFRGGGGGDAALFVGSLPLKVCCLLLLFFGSLPWSFISVISRAGGEVANLPQRTQGKPDFSFVSYRHLIVHLFCLSSPSYSSLSLWLWLHKPFTTTVSVWCQRYISYTIYRTLKTQPIHLYQQ